MLSTILTWIACPNLTLGVCWGTEVTLCTIVWQSFNSTRQNSQPPAPIIILVVSYSSSHLVHIFNSRLKLKRNWTLLVITQNNFKHKNLLGNEQRRAVESIKKTSLWSNVVLEKQVSVLTEFETSAEISISSIWKHKTCVTRVFFLPLLSRNFDDQLSSNFHRFSFNCIHVGIHQVRQTGLWQLTKVSSVFKHWRRFVPTTRKDLTKFCPTLPFFP